MTEQFVSFGEQGAQLTYGSYLRLPQLLDAQHLESDPPAHDELLFITIHQVYELWFKQLLHEVGAARDAMMVSTGSTSKGLWWAQHLLQRVHVIERVLVQQIDVLETMTPQDFMEFRQRLAPASGFQSVQFRELEFLSGAKDPGVRRPLPWADRPREGAAAAPPGGADAVGRVPCRPRRCRPAHRHRRGRGRVRFRAWHTTAPATPRSGRSPRRCSSTTSWRPTGARGTW